VFYGRGEDGVGCIRCAAGEKVGFGQMPSVRAGVPQSAKRIGSAAVLGLLVHWALVSMLIDG